MKRKQTDGMAVNGHRVQKTGFIREQWECWRCHLQSLTLRIFRETYCNPR